MPHSHQQQLVPTPLHPHHHPNPFFPQIKRYVRKFSAHVSTLPLPYHSPSPPAAVAVPCYPNGAAAPYPYPATRVCVCVQRAPTRQTRHPCCKGNHTHTHTHGRVCNHKGTFLGEQGKQPCLPRSFAPRAARRNGKKKIKMSGPEGWALEFISELIATTAVAVAVAAVRRGE